MRDRASLVIVEFVPVAHSPDTLAENRRIECDMGIEEGELLSTRWIKLMQRCAMGQKSVHLIAHLETNNMANSAIKEGVVIVEKRVGLGGCGKSPGGASIVSH